MAGAAEGPYRYDATQVGSLPFAGPIHQITGGELVLTGATTVTILGGDGPLRWEATRPEAFQFTAHDAKRHSTSP